jgi:hypothetical protein
MPYSDAVAAVRWECYALRLPFPIGGAREGLIEDIGWPSQRVSEQAACTRENGHARQQTISSQPGPNRTIRCQDTISTLRRIDP